MDWCSNSNCMSGLSATAQGAFTFVMVVITTIGTGGPGVVSLSGVEQRSNGSVHAIDWVRLTDLCWKNCSSSSDTGHQYVYYGIPAPTGPLTSIGVKVRAELGAGTFNGGASMIVLLCQNINLLSPLGGNPHDRSGVGTIANASAAYTSCITAEIGILSTQNSAVAVSTSAPKIICLQDGAYGQSCVTWRVGVGCPGSPGPGLPPIPSIITTWETFQSVYPWGQTAVVLAGVPPGCTDVSRPC